MTETRKVAVVAGNRIPFARQDKTYRHASNSDMLTAALNGRGHTSTITYL